MIIKKESFEMLYQLIFGVVAFWIIIAFPKISLVPIFVLGAIIFVVRCLKRGEVLDR